MKLALLTRLHRSRCLVALPARCCVADDIVYRENSTSANGTATTTTAWTSDDTAPPKLVQVPTLPILGSLIPAHSGIPRYKQHSSYYFWPEMRRRFGDFYSFGLPGLGQGLHAIVHVIQDPQTMAALLRQEGKYPWGAAQFSFGLHQYFRDRRRVGQHFFSKGPEWKRVRSFVQTDLLSPTSSERYLPAIVEAARFAVQSAPHYAAKPGNGEQTKNGLNDYLNYASFDMFSNAMLGRSTRITDPHHVTDPVDEEFCENVAIGLRANSQMNRNLWDVLYIKVLKLDPMYSSRFREFATAWDAATVVSEQKIQALTSKSPDEMTDAEKSSYCMAALTRAEDPAVNFTLDEAKDMVQGLMTAGVDTTGGTLTWKVLHVALSPEAQERIYQEQLALSGGNPDTVQVTPDSCLQRNAPYLHACIRESHRLANPAPAVPQKQFEQSVTVHGVQLPPGSRVVLDGYSTGVDPELVGDENANDFEPERFLPRAVQARQGTRAGYYLDHAFFKGPFSQGARKCPGSRVANLEVAAFLACLCVEWKMTVPNVRHWSEVPYGLETLLSCYLPDIEFTPRRRR